MWTRLGPGLCLVALAAIALITSATAAPIDRTTSLLSSPTGVADPNSADAFFAGNSSFGFQAIITTRQKLTAADTDTSRVDVYERAGGVTTLVSQPTGVADPDTSDVTFEFVDVNGARVFFTTTQKLTSDDNDSGRRDLYQRTGGVTTLVSQPTGVADPDSSDVSFRRASNGGDRVFFTTTQKLTSDDGDTSRIDVYERSGGTTKLVTAPTGVSDPDSESIDLAGISADGTHAFFTTTQKMTTTDTETGRQDLYERVGTTTTLVSEPTGLAASNLLVAVTFGGSTSNGSRVFFTTDEKLSTADTDGNRQDVYERSGGVSTLRSGPTGVADPNNGDVQFSHASSDGNRVLFQTTQKLATADLDSNRRDVYEHFGGTTSLLSGPSGVADPNSADVDFSDAKFDGTVVFFQTIQKLTATDTDSARQDIYERSGGTTKLLSGPSGVADPNSAGVAFSDTTISGDRVFFETTQKLVASDTDTNRQDVYESSGGVTALVSRPAGIADPNTDDVFFGGAAGDGNRVFLDTAQKLTADDVDSARSDTYTASDTTDPETTITAGPSGTTSDSTPTFSFSSNEAAASFRCAVDGKDFGDCRSPHTLQPLADGPHTFQVGAIDAVRRFDESPAARSFTVDTTPGGVPGPTSAQIEAALSGDLKAAAKVLRKLGTRKLRTRRRARVKGVDGLLPGTVRITARVKRTTILRGSRRFTRAGKATLTLRLTSKGRRLLRRGRRLKLSLSGTFTDSAGHKISAKARKLTIRR